MTRQFSVLGKGLARKDALEKATGTARYIPDMQLPHMLHAKFLRSPHAHAKISHIDTSKAEALPGVRCVLTHKNVPKVHPMRKFEYLLDETVHHPGEEVAAVAAISTEIASEALKLIDVDYKVLPAVFDPEEALKPDAPRVNLEYDANVFLGTELVQMPRIDDDGWWRIEVGDVDKGFQEADYILEGNYRTPMQYNCSPQPRGVVCEWTGDKLTAWADTQVPLYLVRELSNSLSMPQSKIRVIASHSVGGYGGKSPEKTATLAAILAKRTGRPVKAIFTRPEDFIGTHHRIEYLNHNKIGFKKDGSITAMHSRILANWGSDTAVHCICQSTAMLDACTMLYRWQNSKAETRGALTNLLGYGPMNGFGDPEANYAVERIIDEAAEKIDMDPVQFRRKNCIRYGDRAMDVEQVMFGPIEWGIVGPDFDIFPELIQKTAEKAGWKDKWKGWKTPVSIDGYQRRGIGVAIGMHHCCFWPSSAIVKMNQDGTANVLSGAVEIGQGYATAISQVVSEALGIRYEDVNPILADSNTTPTCVGNVASSGTSSPMNAAKIAADDAKRKIFEFAAQRLGVTVDELEARDRKVYVKASSKFIPIADICMENWQITGTGNNPPYHAIRDEKTGKVIHAYAMAVTIVEVEVDIETGNVDLLRVVSGHDTGRSINPIVVENQIDLGLTMAAGWMLSEEYLIDKRSGIIMNPNLLDYKLTTFLDIPERDDFQRIVMEKECAWGPFGAKGFSETSMTALPPAIANAIYNATGTRVCCGPLTPSYILDNIEATVKGGES